MSTRPLMPLTVPELVYCQTDQPRPAQKFGGHGRPADAPLGDPERVLRLGELGRVPGRGPARGVRVDHRLPAEAPRDPLHPDPDPGPQAVGVQPGERRLDVEHRDEVAALQRPDRGQEDVRLGDGVRPRRGERAASREGAVVGADLKAGRDGVGPVGERSRDRPRTDRASRRSRSRCRGSPGRRRSERPSRRRGSSRSSPGTARRRSRWTWGRRRPSPARSPAAPRPARPEAGSCVRGGNSSVVKARNTPRRDRVRSCRGL